MKDRTRLLIGGVVSLVVHDILFGAVPAWTGDVEVTVSEGDEVSIEVLALDPESVREILEPDVRRSNPCLLEADSRHPSQDLELMPRLAIERPTEIIDTPRPPDLVLPPIDTFDTVPRELDLLRPAPIAPVVDVTPEPVDEPPPPVAREATGPPRLENLSGLVVYREPLAYPVPARRRGIEGTASIAVEVGPDGRVVRTRVLQSSGNRLLDRAAQRNLKQWRFDPVAVAAAGWGNEFRQDMLFTIDG